MDGGFMKKILALAAFLVFITSCGGGTIGDAQEFEPNEPPSIIDVKAVSLNGSSTDSLKAGMKFTITVKAHDPENKKLKFQFNSDYGTFGNPVNTDDSCTIPFVTGSFVRPGLPVTVAVSVVDHKDASAATNYEIGKGRRGPTVTVRYEGSAYIQKEKNTRISFKADCEGIYQLYCDNGVDESSAGLRPASDYFLYRKDENGNFKDIIVDIAGPASSTEAKVKLSTPEFRNKVWVVFSDGINDPFAALAPVTVDNTPPQINIIDTSGTTGVGLRSPLRLVFDEEIMPSSVSDSSVKLEDNGSFFSLLKPNPSGKCSVEGNIVTFVPDGLEYYSKYKVSGRSGIKDLAGNEYTGSTNGTFTTVEKGTTPKPYFSKAADTYNDAQTVNIFVSDPDTKIFYTTAIGSAEADTPTPESNEYTGTAVNAEVNTSIKAVAVTRGYKQSSVASVKIKIRTPMPEFQLSTCLSYPVQSFAESTIVYPTGGVNYATIDIANAYPSGTEIKYNQSDSVGNWDNTLSMPVDPKTTSSSDWIQMTKNPGAYRYAVYAKSPNMEPSETVYSTIYRVRGLSLTSAILSVFDSAYMYSNTETKKWKAVSCSSSGKYVAAIEGNPNGYIWVSDDYGVTWMQSKAGLKNWNSCYVSKTDPAGNDLGNDGKYMTTTRSENVCRSINYGMDWTFPVGGLNIRNAVYFDTTKYWIAYGVSNKVNGNNSQEITDSALEAFSADGSIVFYSLALETKLKYWENPESKDIDFVGGGYTVNSWKDLAISGNGSTTAAIAYYGAINFLCYGDLSKIYPVDVVNDADFRDITISYDGKYIAACVMDGLVYRNKIANSFTGSGVSWFAESFDGENKSWSGVAINGTGNEIFAAMNGGDIWCANYNESIWNWSSQNTRTWTGVACSSDGKFIAACDGGAGVHGGYIYTSSNGGANWNLVKKDSDGNSMQKKWNGISMSKDGVLVAAIAEKEMFLSKDSGKNWVKCSINPGNNLKRISVSGTSGINARIVAIQENFYHMCDRNGSFLTGFGASTNYTVNDVYVSNDATTILFAASGYSVLKAGSSGGIPSQLYTNGHTAGRIIASDDLSKVFFSTGSSIDIVSNILGSSPTSNTKTPSPSFSNFSCISVSLDGNFVNAFTNDGYIYSSVDGGSAWVKQTSAGNKGWNCIASTADGLTIFAGGTKQTGIMMLK
jgi:hypothetical protein